MGPAIKNVTTSSSEIDDIFTRKAKTTILHSSTDPKQKKRKKKRSETQNTELKRPPPEIVLDPSTQPSHASETVRHDRSVPPKKKRKIVEKKVDQDKFTDSRGTGPRKAQACPLPLPSASLSPQPLAGRKTDEGFAIYKEDELGINAEAGGQFNSSILLVFIHIFTSPKEHYYVPSIVIVVSVVPLFPLAINDPV
jgi:hypothetical protein